VNKRLLLFCLFTGFTVSFLQTVFAQQPELDRYISLTNYLPAQRWESSENISFGSSGIVLTNNDYNPLNITQYAIVCYYNYIDTGEKSWQQKFLAQVHYFKDSSKVHLLHNDLSIGLPYKTDYKDIKAPWYSGMTQGTAISFLLRYYKWSNDSSVLPIVQKIAHLMILPVEKGGCISKTPENMSWIEEYPNSKISPQVLNGFLNGWIGLHEYCLFFPEDTLARRIRNECLYALRNSLDKYEFEFGPLYNRLNVIARKNYLRYQTLEMEQIYRLTGEELFRKQMMLWSYLVDIMPDTEKVEINLLNDFRFSVPLISKENEMIPDYVFQSSPAENEKPPYYTYYRSAVIPSGKTLSLSSTHRFAGNPVVFYRSNSDSTRIDRTPWKVNNNYSLTNNTLLPIKPENLYFQFLFIYEIKGPETVVSAIKIGD